MSVTLAHFEKFTVMPYSSKRKDLKVCYSSCRLQDVGIVENCSIFSEDGSMLYLLYTNTLGLLIGHSPGGATVVALAGPTSPQSSGQWLRIGIT